MPRLLIDATAICKEAKGVGRYAYHLVDQLTRRLDDDWTIYALLSEAESASFGGANHPIPVRLARHSELVMGLVSIPMAIQTYRPDVVLTSNEIIAGNLAVPRISILHDLEELIDEAGERAASAPRRGLERLKRFLRVFFLRRCRTVICNSQFVADASVSRYGLDPERLRIGFCGVDRRFYDGQEDKAAFPETENRWSGYVLTFATGDTREGFSLLPDIWKRVKAELADVGLVVAGVRDGSDYLTDLRRSFRSAGIIEGDGVVFVPFLGEDEFAQLRALYRNADFYLELSRHEGFGMQLAEAMACGTTCISSGCGALSEVGGRYAITLEDLEPETVAATTVDSYRRRLHERDNAEQVAFTRRYDWDSVGALVVQELRAMQRTRTTYSRIGAQPARGQSQAD